MELVEDMVGKVDSDGVGVEQGDDGEMLEQGDEGELGVVEGQGDDEVGVVVGLGKGKEDTLVCGGSVMLVCLVPRVCPLKITG